MIGSGPPAAAVAHAEVKLALPGSQALTRGRLQHFQPGIVMRRPDVPDIPRPPVGRMHDLTAVAPDAVFSVRT